MDQELSAALKTLSDLASDWGARLARLEHGLERLAARVEQMEKENSAAKTAATQPPAAAAPSDAPPSESESARVFADAAPADPPSIAGGATAVNDDAERIAIPGDNNPHTWGEQWAKAVAKMERLGFSLPALESFWQSFDSEISSAARAERIKRAKAELKAWAEASRDSSEQFRDVTKLAAGLYCFLREGYTALLENQPIYLVFQSLAEEFKSAGDALIDVPAAASLDKGGKALADWQQLMERENRWWDESFYDYRSAVALAETHDELIPLNMAGRFDNLLKCLLSFLKMLDVKKDPKLTVGTLHKNLTRELQNYFAVNPPRNAPIGNLKISKVIRNRWVRYDRAGNQELLELCKPCYDAI